MSTNHAVASSQFEDSLDQAWLGFHFVNFTCLCLHVFSPGRIWKMQLTKVIVGVDLRPNVEYLRAHLKKVFLLFCVFFRFVILRKYLSQGSSYQTQVNSSHSNPT